VDGRRHSSLEGSEFSSNPRRGVVFLPRRVTCLVTGHRNIKSLHKIFIEGEKTKDK
jgi:hypothetical protein